MQADLSNRRRKTRMLHTDWRNLPEQARGLVLALGNFDGVHRGHAHLLHAAHAARPDRPRGVLTFPTGEAVHA